MSDNERRYVLVPVDPHLVAEMVAGRCHLDFDSKLPEDAKLLDVNYDWPARCFLMAYTHPSFDVVPFGEVPPRLCAKATIVKNEFVRAMAVMMETATPGV